ncbi:MAG: Sec-independent protein translocase protein TatB [Solidesulfovibrio sp.]
MFGIGSTELLVILVVALIVIGPSKLPDIMKTLGKGMAEFRRMSSDVKSTLESEVERADREQRQAEAKKTLYPEQAAAGTAEAAAAATPIHGEAVIPSKETASAATGKTETVASGKEAPTA